MTNRFLFLLTILSYCLLNILAQNSWATLKCTCNAENCNQASGVCIAKWNLFGPDHCELVYEANKTSRGCNLTNSHCSIVPESVSYEITYANGALASFSGCCDEDKCDNSTLQNKLNDIKNASCEKLSQPAPGNFSCHCDPKDMKKLYDLSLQRGVVWSLKNGGKNDSASQQFQETLAVRRRLAELCVENTCNFGQINDPQNSIPIPRDAFPICAHYVLAKDGQAIRGCTFAPTKNAPAIINAFARIKSDFPPNPTSTNYDVRVGINVTSKYNFIFECRSDLCNEDESYQAFVHQCLPDISIPKPSNPLEEHHHHLPSRQYEENVGAGATSKPSLTTTEPPATTAGVGSNRIFGLLCIVPMIIFMNL